MLNSRAQMPSPRNEPVFDYAPGQPQTAALKGALKELLGTQIEAAPILDGKELRTGKTTEIHPPHRTSHRLGVFHEVGAAEVAKAIEGARRAAPGWAAMAAEDRAAIFLKAADLLAGKYRYRIAAATMLGQSKTCHQAEIDASCELVDFLRYNCAFQEQIYQMQPYSPPGMWNRLDYRALEGFVFAVTPFNFTAIAGNLPTSAALMGNVVLWKPASTSVYSNYLLMKVFEEAGLPPGVIQFLPGSGGTVGDPVLKHRDLAGVHFTGSTRVFQQMWGTIGANIQNYKSYPRIVGETGGKDFIVAHPSADEDVIIAALVRGAYEYQGQKCSAASRCYLPKSLWPRLKERLIEEIKTMKVGDVADFSCFMGAVIDAKSRDNIRGYLDRAKASSAAKILTGGEFADGGYFVSPTLIEVADPKYQTMCEEIFGPVLSVYIYDDAKWEETLHLIDDTSMYALTGAILARDREAIAQATRVLSQSAGNFYINNKCTGAVVGQQPFGGARGSGTNDKAGSLFNLLRWTSTRTVSETLLPPTNYRYPYLG
ncbi:L-glutamate gamma-semialdehyde dehydrogenase [bacterium]|nr:L-glutamate gamma-semialdehyde dehydrogenase [bacterium]